MLFSCSRSVTKKYQDDDIILGDKVIPKDATLKALQSLGATFNFIDIWLHTFIKKN